MPAIAVCVRVNHANVVAAAAASPSPSPSLSLSSPLSTPTCLLVCRRRRRWRQQSHARVRSGGSDLLALSLLQAPLFIFASAPFPRRLRSLSCDAVCDAAYREMLDVVDGESADLALDSCRRPIASRLLLCLSFSVSAIVCLSGCCCNASIQTQNTITAPSTDAAACVASE